MEMASERWHGGDALQQQAACTPETSMHRGQDPLGSALGFAYHLRCDLWSLVGGPVPGSSPAAAAAEGTAIPWSLLTAFTLVAYSLGRLGPVPGSRPAARAAAAVANSENSADSAVEPKISGPCRIIRRRCAWMRKPKCRITTPRKLISRSPAPQGAPPAPWRRKKPRDQVSRFRVAALEHGPWRVIKRRCAWMRKPNRRIPTPRSSSGEPGAPGHAARILALQQHSGGNPETRPMAHHRVALRMEAGHTLHLLPLRVPSVALGAPLAPRRSRGASARAHPTLS